MGVLLPACSVRESLAFWVGRLLAYYGIDVPAGPVGPSLTTAIEILGEDYSRGRRFLSDALAVPEAELDAIAEGCGDELGFHAILALGRTPIDVRESTGALRLDRADMSPQLRRRIEAGP